MFSHSKIPPVRGSLWDIILQQHWMEGEVSRGPCNSLLSKPTSVLGIGFGPKSLGRDTEREGLLSFVVHPDQVNFYHDHTKLLLNWAGEEPLLTYIDQERQATSRPLGSLQCQGCSEALRQRLCYTLCLLRTL